MDTDTKTKPIHYILAIGFSCFFIAAIYAHIKNTLVWSDNPTIIFTKAISHRYTLIKGGSQIQYQYEVEEKKYFGSYLNPNSDSYSKICDYLVGYPENYPEEGRLYLNSCIANPYYLKK